MAKGQSTLRGGWYDATGDYGIHLSHQNLTSYFNPQQVPLVAWTLLASYNTLKARNDDNFSEYERRLLDEGLFGADFLVRIKRPGGSFFQNIDSAGAAEACERSQDRQPELAHADQDESVANPPSAGAMSHSDRMPMRRAIAPAAACPSQRLRWPAPCPQDGDFPRAKYLATAEDAFAFLEAHNRELLERSRRKHP